MTTGRGESERMAVVGKNYKWKINKFTVVLVAEAVWMFFLVLKCFDSCAAFIFDKNSFEKSIDGELFCYDKDAVGLEVWPDSADTQGQQTEGFELLNCRAVMCSGAYEVKVFYDSVSGQNAGNIDQSAGSLRFYTENGAVLRASDLRLVDSLHEAESRFWLRPGCGESEVWLSVWHNGSGRLAVREIRIEERRIYRVVQCAAAAFFMAFCNFLYLVFARGGTGCRSRKTKWIIAGILGITVSASITYFTDFLYFGHDLRFHISRIISLAESLCEMQIPHRLQFDMLNGYGYASPLFYGELFLLFPAILYNFYVPVQTCYQIFVTGVNFCTCLVSFWCFTKMARDWKKGLFGSFLYTLSAYRMTNVMVRAAVGEYTAMIFLPLFVYGLWNIYVKRRDEKTGLREYLPIVMAASGVIHSHILSCGMTAVFLLLFVLLQWKKTFRKNTLIALVKSGVLVFLLNLWFLIPFVMSMRMDINVSSGGLWRVESNGVYPVQLFGIFHTASGENVFWGSKQEMPLALGLPLVMGMVLFLAVYIQKDVWGLLQDADMKAAKACMVLGIAAVFMASSFCWWDNLPGISERLARAAGVIQFPWRYLGMASVLLIAMLMFLLRVLEGHMTKRSVWCAMAGFAIAAVLTEGYFVMDYADVQDELHLYSGADLGTMVVSGAEYKLAGTDLEGYKVKDVLHEEGVENISFYYDKNGTYYLSCENRTGHLSYVDVPVQMYDHYHAYQDDMELSLTRGENNRIRVLLPVDFAGTVCLKYTVPLLWRICEVISCVTFCVLLCVLVKTGNVGKKRKPGIQ